MTNKDMVRAAFESWKAGTAYISNSTRYGSGRPRGLKRSAAPVLALTWQR